MYCGIIFMIINPKTLIIVSKFTFEVFVLIIIFIYYKFHHRLLFFFIIIIPIIFKYEQGYYY